MQNNFFRIWWRSIDRQIIVALLILFAFSFMLVTTSGVVVAGKIGLDEQYFSSRQAVYLAIAAGLIIVFSLLSKKAIKRIAIMGFLTSIVLLILVKFYGYEVKGAVRWLNIFGISVQPSEFIKPFFIVVTGWILSLKFVEYHEGGEDFPSFYICMVLYAMVAVLLMMQPDFGMLIVITAVFGVQLFVAGMPLFFITLILIGSIFGVFGAYFIFPHVANRINNFLDPESSENYQVSKSIMAFENGGIYGRGPGEGTVKQFLPDSHTDFIFAVAGEEFGAIICLFIIGVFAFIVLRILFRIIKEEDKFIQFAGVGIVTQFGLQAVINIGVTLNLLPTKGMTLPFISYGGSSTIALAVALGILIAFTKKTTSLTGYKLRDIESSI